MGYAVVFREMALDELKRRLHEDATVAAFAAAGGGDATPEVGDAVVRIVLGQGRELGALDHSSSGGDWFREELFGETIASVLGDDLAWHLLERPLEGITWPEYPSIGWVTNTELREALERRGELPGDLDDDDVEAVQDVVSAVERAAESGSDLVTVYA